MARSINRLSSRSVTSKNKRGRYADGGGLYLQVSDNEAKSWLFRFMLNGKSREMGLGSLHTISLAEARDEALLCRKQLRDNIDPINARKLKRGQAAKAVLEVKKELGDRASVQQFSALKRSGEDEAREVLERFLRS